MTPSVAKVFPKLTSEEIEAEVAAANVRRGEYYATRLRLFLNDTPTRERGGVVFLGDSITEQFPTDEAFAGKNVINRGIGGDQVGGVIERLDVCVEQLEPKRVYLMISINNFAWSSGVDMEALAAEYGELLKEIRTVAPDTELIVLSVLPLGAGREGTNPQVIWMNEKIQAMVAQQGLEFVNLHPFFCDENGLLRAEYTTDGCHLTLKGYLVWLEHLLGEEEFVDAMLGLSEKWNSISGQSRKIDGINIERDTDDLIVYTPAAGEKTKTNEWGLEAVVENGVVTKIGGNNNAIPENGFVISGHVLGANWISSALDEGATVELDGEVIKVNHPKEDELTDLQLFEFGYYYLIASIAQLDVQGQFDSAKRAEAIELLSKYHATRLSQDTVDRVMATDLVNQSKEFNPYLLD